MDLQLDEITVYNAGDTAVLEHVAKGELTQTKLPDSFATAINLPGASADALAAGDSYYVVGLQPDGYPFRSEAVQLQSAKGGALVLAGSIALGDRTAAVAADSQADMLINYSNYSSTSFSLSTNWSNLQDGFGGLTSSPGPILQASSGHQSMGANQLLSTLDEGPADIGLCWAAGYNFGVWIHFNFQMLDMGPRPVWYVTTNGSAWVLAGSDPSNPYTWDASQVGGLKIVGSPTSGHSSLTVDVVISNQ